MAAVLWGTFAVVNDPSRSGSAPMQVPGIVRLLLELVFFASATWALYFEGQSVLALVFGLILLVHYEVFYDCILWLRRQ